MAMSLRSKTLVTLLGLLLTASFVAEATAGNRGFRHRDHRNHRVNSVQHHNAHRIVFRPRINIRQRVVINIGSNWRRTHSMREVNTYSGAVDISYRPGVGNWSYGTTSSIRNVSNGNGRSMKILILNNGTNGCRMERGVCVIRN
jgi:hypothetical protein